MAYMAHFRFSERSQFSEAKCAIATSFHWWNCKHFSPSQHHSIDDLQAVQVTALSTQKQRRRQMPQMPVETSTFFWNFKAIFDHWCLHWFTIDSCRYRSRCCSRTRCDTFFSRRVESLNSGIWFCCHARASGHIIFAIQGRPVSDSVTLFCVVTCPERKLKRYSGEQSLSQAGAEASDPWNFPSRGDVERFQWNFTKGRSSNQIAKKRGNVNLAGQSLLGLGDFSILSKLPQQEKRAVLPFDQVFKAEWEEQVQDGSHWIIGTACFIDGWNLRNTFVVLF